MRPRDAAVIAIRVAAIYFAVQAAANLASLFSILGEDAVPTRFVVQVLIPPFVYGIAALTLWAAASTLAGAMTRETAGDGAAPAGRIRTIHTVAISVAGLVVLVLAIPGLIQLLFESTDTIPDFRLGTVGTRGARVAAILVQIGLGLYLWLGAASLANMLRYEEAPPPPPPSAFS